MFEKIMKYERTWNKFYIWLSKNSSFNFNNRIKKFEYGFGYSVDEKDFKIIFLLMPLFFIENKIIFIPVYDNFQKTFHFKILLNPDKEITATDHNRDLYMIIEKKFEDYKNALIDVCEKAFEILEGQNG